MLSKKILIIILPIIMQPYCECYFNRLQEHGRIKTVIKAVSVVCVFVVVVELYCKSQVWWGESGVIVSVVLMCAPLLD